MKKYISSFFLSLLALFLLTLPLSAEASEKTEVPTLAVDGSGVALTTPDQACISIGITTDNSNAQTAQQENAAIAQKIQQALLAAGISKDSMRTASYNFSPIYSTQENHTREITGYNVSNTITVLVNDVNMTGNVIDLALANGANEIDSLSFSVKNTGKLRQSALTAAIKDAQEKANIMAAACGKSITGIKTVSESGSSLYTRQFDNMLLAKATAGTPIEPGNVNYTANVHVEFYLNE